MGVIDLGENGGSLTEEEDGTVTLERKWWAKVESGRDSEDDVLQDRRLPRRGEMHDRRRNCMCTSVIATRRTPGNRLFDVSATYSNKWQQEENENPLARAARISMRTVWSSEPLLTDAKGKLVLNTAGDALDGYTRPIPGRAIRIEKNLSSWPDWINSYATAMNSDTVRIRGRTFPPHTLKMGALDIPDEEIENSVRFFRISLELLFNPLTWVRRFWNRGYYQIAPGWNVAGIFTPQFRLDGEGKEVEVDPPEGAPPSRKFVPIYLADGSRPSEPQWLDHDGRWIVDPRENRDRIVSLEYHDLDELPFSRLPLK